MNADASSDPDLAAQRRALLYRARYRGTLEADFLIGGFAAAFVPTAGAAELEELATLLACDDPILDNLPSGHVEGPTLRALRTFCLQSMQPRSNV